MNNIWDQNKPIFILAPMEAVTDVVFRHVIKRAASPDIFFSEFTNATAWYRAGDKATGGRLIKTSDETNLIAQLWGTDVESMSHFAKHIKELGFAGIDINMGCPDKSAIKSGGGAAMIKNPLLATKIIEAARATDLPVSVKTRIGYSSLDEMENWISTLLKQNLIALTVHLRTKKEMSKVPAHYELIPKIIELRNKISPNTKLIWNGDIKNYKEGISLLNQYGGDGIMIGRGVFTNPFAFEKEERIHSRKELLDLLFLQLDLYDQYKTKLNRPFDTLKRYFKIYIRDFDGASELRNELMTKAKSTDDTREIINNFLNNK
jgi:dihydrouridine synthase duS